MTNKSVTILKVSVLALSILLHIIWAFVIPPFQGNDEERHFATILFFTEEKRFISKQDQGLGFRESNWYKNLRSEVINHESHRVFANSIYHRDYSEEQKVDSEIDEINVSPGYPYQPGYYVISSIAGSLFSSLQTKLYIARLISVMFSVLTVYLVFKIIRFITKKEMFAIVGMALVGFFPIVTYAGSMVNNDSMLGFSATWCLYLLLLLQKKLTMRSVLLLSIGLATGFMSKPQFIPIGLITIIITLYLIFSQVKQWRRRMQSLLVLFSLSTIVALPWYIFNLTQFNSFFPQVYDPGVGISGFVQRTNVESSGIHSILFLLKSVFVRWFSYLPPRFGGDFGQVDVHAPTLIDTFFQLFFILVAVRVVFLAVKSILNRRKIFFHTIAFILFALTLEGLYSYLWLRGIWRSGSFSFPLFARYYFPLSSIGAYTVIRVFSLGKNLRYFTSLLFAVPVILITYNYYCLLLVISRYYL